MPNQALINDMDRLAASHRRRLRSGPKLSDRLAQAEEAAKAAVLRPALANTLYRGVTTLDETVEITSSDLDNREAPTCECGAPVYANGLCVACDETRFEARNRAQTPSEQRD